MTVARECACPGTSPRPSQGIHHVHLLSHARRARLSIAIAAALLGPTSPLLAGTLVGVPHTVASGDAKETWILSRSARLTLDPGAVSDAIDSIESSVTMNGAALSATGTGLMLKNGSGGKYRQRRKHREYGRHRVAGA